MADVLESFRSILSAYVEQDFLTATKRSTLAIAVAGCLLSDSMGEGCIRMLIHEGRGIVDFVVNHKVAIARLTTTRNSKDLVVLQVLGF